MDIKLKLAEEFGINARYAANIVDLIDDGNTIPFIARYRKEMHGAQSDELLRDFADRLTYLRNLEKRKEEIRASVTEQGKWTDALAAALDAAVTLAEAEDIYRPYKQKKKTRAGVAAEKGLRPLADLIYAQEDAGELETLAAGYVDAEKGVDDVRAALSGASDIIAEYVSDSADVRRVLRDHITATGVVTSAPAKDAPADKLPTYEMYFEYSEPVKKIPAHRILALNRGEKEECLKVSVTADEESCFARVGALVLKPGGAYRAFIESAIADSFSPSDIPLAGTRGALRPHREGGGVRHQGVREQPAPVAHATAPQRPSHTGRGPPLTARAVSWPSSTSRATTCGTASFIPRRPTTRRRRPSASSKRR